MSVLKLYTNKDCNQFSPTMGDVYRNVEKDEDGNEHVTFKPIDFEKIRKENGSVGNWSISALLQSGISPNFNIHTGYNTRMEGAAQVNAAEQYAKQLVNEKDESNN